MRILIDIFTRNVVGINKDPNASTYVIDTPDINPTKTIEHTLTKQQTNEYGLPLYLKDSSNLNSITTKAFEDIDSKISYYTPIMKNEKITQTYKLLENPSYFTIEDVIEAKGKEILKDSEFKNIIIKEINSENLISKSAHISIDYIKLLPNGECQTSLIDLTHPAKIVGIYVESDEGIEIEAGKDISNPLKPVFGKIELESESSQIYIRFKNTDPENEKVIKAYGVLF